MQVYGLFYFDIDATLVKLWLNEPTPEQVKEVLMTRGWRFDLKEGPDDEKALAKILAGVHSEYFLDPVSVVEN